MVTVKIDANANELVNTFVDIRRRMADPKPLYSAWANYLESRAVTSFKREQGPTGQPWPELQPSTLASKRRSKIKNKKLQDTGDLFRSLVGRAQPDGAVVGTNRPVGSLSLGAIHQYGTRGQALMSASGFVMGRRGGGIPARPFLPVGDGDKLLDRDIIRLNRLAVQWIQGPPGPQGP